MMKPDWEELDNGYSKAGLEPSHIWIPEEPVSKALIVPVVVYSSLRRKPEPRCRPLVDG